MLAYLSSTCFYVLMVCHSMVLKCQWTTYRQAVANGWILNLLAMPSVKDQRGPFVVKQVGLVYYSLQWGRTYNVGNCGVSQKELESTFISLCRIWAWIGWFGRESKEAVYSRLDAVRKEATSMFECSMGSPTTMFFVCAWTNWWSSLALFHFIIVSGWPCLR